MNFIVRKRLYFIILVPVIMAMMTEYRRVESIRGGADSAATCLVVTFLVTAFYIHQQKAFTRLVKEFFAILVIPTLYMALNNLALGYSLVNWVNTLAVGGILWFCLYKR